MPRYLTELLGETVARPEHGTVVGRTVRMSARHLGLTFINQKSVTGKESVDGVIHRLELIYGPGDDKGVITVSP